MKVLAINGSANKKGNTYQAIQVAAGELEAQGIAVETVTIGDKLIRGCTGCHSCHAQGSCVIKDDDFEEIMNKVREADGLLLGSPVYYGGITGTMKSFLDRAFFSGARDMRYKVGGSLVVLRRSGAMSAYEQLNNFMTATEMLVAPCCWTVAFGAFPGEIHEDKEGLWRLRTLGKNMAWLLKMKEATKDTVAPPESEERVFFNYIR
jgi:multimeric flavodoxin WrbA